MILSDDINKIIFSIAAKSYLRHILSQRPHFVLNSKHRKKARYNFYHDHINVGIYTKYLGYNTCLVVHTEYINRLYGRVDRIEQIRFYNYNMPYKDLKHIILMNRRNVYISINLHAGFLGWQAKSFAAAGNRIY